MNFCCFLALFLKVLLCLECRWNLKVWPCTFRKDSLSSTLYLDCLTQFSEYLCTDWVFVNLLSTSAPLSAHPRFQLLICSRHINLNGKVKHSLSFMIVVTFFSHTVKILQFTHHSHKTSKMLFFTLSVLLLYMVILKLNWLWHNKRKVWSLII